MNVFILSTACCGSIPFAKACEHMTNFTVGHESLSRRNQTDVLVPYSLLTYPKNHIEVDNRLSWFLGRLDLTYGADAFYVHLLRDSEDIAESLVGQWHNTDPNIIFSYAWGILKHHYENVGVMSQKHKMDIAQDYCRTINENIVHFLQNKPYQMTMWWHDISPSFQSFWKQIEAEGDVQRACAELQVSAPSPCGGTWN